MYIYKFHLQSEIVINMLKEKKINQSRFTMRYSQGYADDTHFAHDFIYIY